MQSSLPFVLVIPGKAPITNFNCDNGIYHLDIQNPGNIANLCLTLIEPLPQNYAVTLYFSQPPYSEMQYLGAISNNRPSQIFSTGFPLRQELANMTSVKICIKGEAFNDIKDLVLVTDGKKEYSKLVAQNLYNYMMSFNKQGVLPNGMQGQFLVIPSNFLTRWLQKFEQKYSKDPNFILKTTVN